MLFSVLQDSYDHAPGVYLRAVILSEVQFDPHQDSVTCANLGFGPVSGEVL